MVFFSPYTGFYNGIYGTCLYLCVNQTQIAVFIFISAWLIGKESIFIVVIFNGGHHRASSSFPPPRYSDDRLELVEIIILGKVK